MWLQLLVKSSMNLETFTEKFADRLPDSPGVYFFLDMEGAVLYIGKATSLRDRVKSYFVQDMLLTRGPKIVRMLELAADIKWRETGSALEALLLEANLIQRYRPTYNTDAKDDKSWNYVVITKERFSRVLVERGRKIEDRISKAEDGGGKTRKEGSVADYEIRNLFGPFPSGGSLKEAVNIVRKIFPFRDVCMPSDSVRQKKDASDPVGRASRQRRDVGGCFNHQIGLCPGVCVGAVSAREYDKTIRNIELFFAGKKTTIIKNLEREMKSEAKALHFERAGEIKKTLFALAHIQDVALLKRGLFDNSSREAGGMNDAKATRIEAYDVAHLGGENTVGVMTVVLNGETRKESYRKFILRGDARGNDLAALEELLRRRLKHVEWATPQLIVVDGSNLQCHVAEAVLKDFSLDIPIVSVLKDEHHQPKGILGQKDAREVFKNDILLANSEAHRFAISFHRERRRKSFLKQ